METKFREQYDAQLTKEDIDTITPYRAVLLMMYGDEKIEDRKGYRGRHVPSSINDERNLRKRK